jgi:RNA polymerase sigma factor (sigma-70 family)
VTPKSLIEPARHAGTALLRSQSDARLVDLTRDGNERAFEAIVQRYDRPLLRYCSRILPAARAEDAVQQAFLSAHRAIHAGDAELNLRPWLYRIAHNAALNLLRQSGFDHEQMSEEIDGVETPPQAFERGERLRTVMAAVQDLPERQRDAIVLQAMEGRSYEEIATELGVSDGAVRQLLNRARNTLREAAAAVTPTGLLTRIASSGGEASVVERVAQLVGGAGGGALAAKAGAALLVTGAVAGGAATGALPGTGGQRDESAASAAIPAPPHLGVAAGGARTVAMRGGVLLHMRNVNLSSPGHGGGGKAGRGRGGTAATGPTGFGGGPGGGPGPSGGGGHGGNSGPGGGDGSGSGSSGSGDGGHSGSGSGSSGSGDGGGGSSGSGSSGSGSGDGGSGPSGSGSSGSGTSGSGGGSSGSGSGDSSGSGSSGSGSSGSGTSGSLSSGSSGSGSSGSGTSGSGSSGSGSSGSGSGDSLDSSSGPG